MLTRTRIRSLTHASFYARGLDLYLTNKVKELKIEEVSFVDHVDTRVKGSGTKMYDVSFSYDTATDTVSGCSCNCPAFASYDGLCNHLVASLLKYTDRKLSEAGQQDPASVPDRQTELWESAGSSGSAPPTTPVMKMLLDRQQTVRIAPLIQNHVFGLVRLEPALVCRKGRAFAEFRVGTTQT